MISFGAVFNGHAITISQDKNLPGFFCRGAIEDRLNTKVGRLYCPFIKSAGYLSSLYLI